MLELGILCSNSIFTNKFIIVNIKHQQWKINSNLNFTGFANPSPHGLRLLVTSFVFLHGNPAGILTIMIDTTYGSLKL